MKTIIDAGCNLLEGFNKLKTCEPIVDSDRKFFIEANPECWPFLEGQIKEMPNAKLLQGALNIDTNPILLTTRADHACDYAATIRNREFLEQSLNRWNITGVPFKQYTVPSFTLLDIIQDNNITGELVVKLDVEGMEYAVLESVLLNKLDIARLYCEFHINTQEDQIKKELLVKELERKGTKVFLWD